jgi:hypothetical protein
LYFNLRPKPIPVVNGPKDPIGDLFDKNGSTTSGELFLDITAVDIQKKGDQYIMLMQLSDNLPKKTPELNTFIEWDFMIDSDNNPSTGTKWPLISNDIGYDYLARFCLYNGIRTHEVLITKSPGGKHSTISYRVIKNVVELTVPDSLIGSPSSFHWTAAVRKYLSDAPAAEPSVSDKVPNQGHFNYPNSSPASAPSAFQGSLTGNWSGQITTGTSPAPVSGTFSVTIDANGSVQGLFQGIYSGIIEGQVDLNGNLIATGTASEGNPPTVTNWQGKLSVSGNSLSTQGDLSGEYVSGSFSGNGNVSR